MDDVQGPPLWVVTSQQETVDRAVSGAYVTGTRISFRTRGGAQGSVFVAAEDYTPDVARARVDKLARDMEAVHNMSGEG